MSRSKFVYYAHKTEFSDSTLFVVNDVANDTEHFINKDGSKSKLHYNIPANTFAEDRCANGVWRRVTRAHVRETVKRLKTPATTTHTTF